MFIGNLIFILVHPNMKLVYLENDVIIQFYLSSTEEKESYTWDDMRLSKL